MRSLRKLIPYYRPYLLQLVGGLAFVVLSAGITSVIPLILRRAIDGMRTGASVHSVVLLAGAIVVTALVGGALRYGMRELLNGLSRWIEYDLRNDLFTHLESLDAAYFARTRTGDIMARLTNDLNAVRMAAGPAIMYLTNTVFGGLFALGFMAVISPRLTVLALLPMVILPIITVKMGHLIHVRFEAVQEHFSTLTTHAQENLSGVRIVRAYRQEAAEIARFAELNEGVSDTQHVTRAAVGDVASDLFAAGWRGGGGGLGCGWDVGVAWGVVGGVVCGVRVVSGHADVAADRVGVGDQSVPAR